MPWAFGLTTKKDGKQMIIDYHGKKVPGGIVDWLDNKGKVHHTEVPIYVIGDKKGYPKISIHGVLDDTRKNFLSGYKEARRARREYRKAVREAKADPEKYKKYRSDIDKAVNKAYEKLEGSPMKSILKKGNPYNGLAADIAEDAVNRAISKKVRQNDMEQRKRVFLKQSEYYEKRKKELEEERKQQMLAQKGMPTIMIDPKDGHMKIADLRLPRKKLTDKLYKNLRRGNNTYLINAPGRKKVAKATHEKSLLNVYPEKIYVAKKTWKEMSLPEKADHARKVLGIKKDAIDPQTKRKYAMSKLVNKYNMLPVATKALHLPN